MIKNTLINRAEKIIPEKRGKTGQKRKNKLLQKHFWVIIPNNYLEKQLFFFSK